jgi:uncharacterized spore protein YtfJ
MNEQETVKETMPAGIDGSFLQRLTEHLEEGANAKAVFGEPIERDGTTVIPVARARWGVGGGIGTRPDQKAVGTGAGGGVVISPVGFIELRGGEACFTAIRSPAFTLGIVIAGAVFGLSALKTVQLLASRQPPTPGRRFWTRRARK